MALARILAVAIRTERIGCVLIEGASLRYWEGSARAAKSPERATEQLCRWIQFCEPDVLVTADPSTSEAQRPILEAFARVGRDASMVNLLIRRRYPCKNIYEEAAALANRFPAFKEIVPEKPPIWRKQPYRLVFFDALALIRDAGLLAPESEENG